MLNAASGQPEEPRPDHAAQRAILSVGYRKVVERHAYTKVIYRTLTDFEALRTTSIMKKSGEVAGRIQL